MPVKLQINMVAVLLLLLLLTPTVFVDGAAVQTDAPQSAFSYPQGDMRNCLRFISNDGAFRYQMEVLPNTGFDNLRNLDLGEVHALSYSTCQVSRDGKYLLPDNFYLIPVQESKVNVFAEYIEHWDEYTSMNSKSINAEAGFHFLGVSGKFSTGYSTTKKHMYNDKSLAKNTRTQLRIKRYTARLQPGAQLHPSFVSRLLDIVASIYDNNTANAHYLSELLVRDYGTHYVYSMDAGAVLAKSDFIKQESNSESSLSTDDFKAAASMSFWSMLSLSGSFEYSTSESTTKIYTHNRVYSEVSTIGGGGICWQHDPEGLGGPN